MSDGALEQARRPALADPTAEDALHDLLFDVMWSARERSAALDTHAGAAADRLEAFAEAAPLDVPRRFVAMRTLLVLGRSLPGSETTLRPRLRARLEMLGLAEPPPEPTPDPLKLSLRNNHLLAQAATLSAWPEVDPARTTRTRLVERALAEMAPDGLFPTELSRGASAIWYSNLSVMLLTTVAHAERGADLKSVPLETLARGVAGLAALIADPSQALAYAQRNIYPHPDHGPDPNALDLGFLSGYRRSRHYMAWTVLAQDLLGADAVPLAPPTSDRFPLCSDYIGGFVDHVRRTP